MKYYIETYTLGKSIWKYDDGKWYTKQLLYKDKNDKTVPVSNKVWCPFPYTPLEDLSSGKVPHNYNRFEEINETDVFLELI